MNRLIFCIILFLLASWSVVESPYSVQIELQSAKLSLLDNVIMKVTLHHTQDTIVDVARIRTNLLDYAGMDGPIWTIGKETINASPRETELTFEMVPQLTGRLPLSARDIQFLDANGKKIESIMTELYFVNIATVEMEDAYLGKVARLMPLTHPYPIELSATNDAQWVTTPQAEALPAIVFFRQRFFQFLSSAVILLVVLGFLYAVQEH